MHGKAKLPKKAQNGCLATEKNKNVTTKSTLHFFDPILTKPTDLKEIQ